MIERNILPILNQLNCNKIEHKGFNLLIDTVLKLAKNYIRHNRGRVYSFASTENEIQDIAIDAIASLFIKNGKERFPICISFEEWNPSIQNEDEAFFFLNKLTASRVEQHISKCLKEADPVFAKILDSLNYVINKYNFKKLRILGQSFIVKKPCDLKSKIITYNDLQNTPSSYFHEIDMVFEKLFDFFEKDTEHYVAIPLNALAIRIKTIQSLIQNTTNVPNCFESLIYANEIVQRGCNIAYDKLNDSYYYKGKLSKSETEIFKNTLHDLAMDLSNGGIHSGLYGYLEKHMVGLSKDEYQTKYHNTLEYLLKIMKNTIKKELEEAGR